MIDFTEFKGLVDFVGADIANNFSSERPSFRTRKGASFNRMKVGGRAFFKGRSKGRSTSATPSLVGLTCRVLRGRRALANCACRE